MRGGKNVVHSLDRMALCLQYGENEYESQEDDMNKTEMAMKLAKKTGLSQGKAAEILDAIFSAQPRKGIIATALDAGEKVTIPGFGTFATKQRGERQGRNPATGATITIPKKKYVTFKPGKTLKERVEV
jgi:DNA-binding protein HU-beta